MDLINNSISENNFFQAALNSLLLATKNILPRKTLSVALGVSESAISQWVKGKTFPDPAKIRGLISLFKAQELDSHQKALLFDFMCSLEYPIHEVWRKAPEAFKDQLLSDYILNDIESDIRSSISLLFYDLKQELFIHFIKQIAIIKTDLENKMLKISGEKNIIDNDSVYDKVRRLKKVQGSFKQSLYSDFLLKYTGSIKEIHTSQRNQLNKALEDSNNEIRECYQLRGINSEELSQASFTSLNRANNEQEKKYINTLVNPSNCNHIHLSDASLYSSNEKIFEDDVAKILQILGYNIQRNVIAKHSKADLYAEYTTGVISYKLIVECKSYKNDRLVECDEIRKFYYALMEEKELGSFYQGLFVTTNGFTSNAKELALTSGIELTTYAELSTKLVNFDLYIDRLINDFDESPIHSYYVDLSGTEDEDYENNQNVKYYRPIDNYINRCFEQDGETKLALLGNFGTGKSTFCQKYARDLANNYKKNKTGRIPVIISLKDFNSKIFIDELILNTLQNRYGININKSIFSELQRLGKFIFLFDGFDEMDGSASPETISSNFKQLDKISEIKENKLIVTCRTHFFRNKVQLEGLEDFVMLYIPEWGEVELKEYLQKKFDTKWREHLIKIKGTNNLPELAQTPLFLELITETLPLLGDHVKRIELYKVYTDKWYNYRTKSNIAMITTEERRSLMKELAMKLYTENRLSCHYTELEEMLKKSLHRAHSGKTSDLALGEVFKLDHFRLDLQTCTFLARNPTGDYSFAHKSFLEFIVAQTLAEDLAKGIVVGLECKILPITIRGFLIDFIKDDTPDEMIINLFKKSREGILKENIVTLASFLKITLPNIKEASSNEFNDSFLLKLLKGETKAFSQLFKMFYSPLYRFSMSIVNNKAVAEDIVADVFTKLWIRRDSIENVRDLKSYLFLLVKNSSLDYIRKSEVKRKTIKNYKYLFLTDDIGKERPLEQFNFSFDKAIEKLSQMDKYIAKMLIDGYSNSEIASKMGLSMQKTRIIRLQVIRSLKKIIAETKE